MTEVLKLRNSFERIPVELEQDGQVIEYELVEMNGTARDSYLNFMTSRIKTKSDGSTNVSDFSNLQADLINRCLKLAGEPVGLKFIQALPATTQNALFEAAQSLNGLDNVVEEDEGND